MNPFEQLGREDDLKIFQEKINALSELFDIEEAYSLIPMISRKFQEKFKEKNFKEILLWHELVGSTWGERFGGPVFDIEGSINFYDCVSQIIEKVSTGQMATTLSEAELFLDEYLK